VLLVSLGCEGQARLRDLESRLAAAFSRWEALESGGVAGAG
jgi:hypothetical protein